MEQNYSELDIVCFHVGGAGDYGHIDVLGRRYPKHTVYVAFEAREDDNDEQTKQAYLEQGLRTILVRECISDKVGKSNFKINIAPASSSIYPISTRTQHEHMPGQPFRPRWDSHATPEKVVELETTTIDKVIPDYDLPDPDILSIDAQGSELQIMQGGINAMKKSVLSVITEIEFYPVYEGQPLFNHQFELLYENGFRLVDIMAQQYWHPLARVGHGMLTVGEAIFLLYGEKYMQRLSVHQLIKYTAIAFAYKRLSVAVHCMNFALEKFGSLVESIIKDNPEFEELLLLPIYVNHNLSNYNKNAFYFEKDELIQEICGPVEDYKNLSLP